MIEAAAAVMKPAYERAAACQGGTGIKKRMLDVLVQHARQHAPKLFINIRHELTEGGVVLQSSLKAQQAKLSEYGAGVLKRIQQSVSNHNIVTPEQRSRLEASLSQLPKPLISRPSAAELA
jgi:hypothetical protein